MNIEYTSGKIHLIGHSLGGSLARAAAAQMPERIRSVITLGAPIRGLAARASVMSAADLVRKQILKRHGRGVLPNCYTSRCTCEFLESLKGDLPKSVRQTAIYTITADSPEAALRSPQLEGFRAKGVEVLLLTDPVDEFWLPMVAKFKEHEFRSVTRGGADLSAGEVKTVFVARNLGQGYAVLPGDTAFITPAVPASSLLVVLLNFTSELRQLFAK